MIERLPWDSEHFGVPIGRVAGSEVSGEDVEAADRSGLRCIYLLADAADATTVHAAEGLGFRLIDFRVTLDRAVRPTDEDATPGDAVRPAVPEDLTVLEPVAATAHVGTRFFSDKGFDQKASARLYVRWLRQSILNDFADLALVAHRGGSPAAYITGREAPDGASLSIGLLGVAARDRGRGLGPMLVAALVRAAATREVLRIDVVTQGSNIPAQRTYQAAGFRTARTEVWLHRWSGVREGPSSHVGRRAPVTETTPLP